MAENPSIAPEVLDLEAFQSLRELQEEGEPDILEDLARSFIEDSVLRVAAIAGAIGREDWLEVKKNAHTLKGSGRNLGAVGVGEICLKMEQAVEAGNAVRLTQLHERLEADIARIKEAFRGLGLLK